ncbi:MOSC domain-containing protein [Streptomyces finlayi]|uniref:MOSC domain-containing protein n=1 Tax=Streptomyces finlayi TaxID=67296 RepID=A0A7G7BTS7_9ACTN|nr:MOSC N-terminal beta barrel domain-containing protein [Streptomyces finlayi]QNE78742.1 MOSC domain-containing protein [Streptomyces finlayi]
MDLPVLQAVHIHPVKSLAAYARSEAAVEPWGLDGDRRWMLVDAAGKAVTQRQRARMARISARPLTGGGIELSAPGDAPLTVRVPAPGRTVAVDLFKQKLEVVEASGDAHAWLGAHLGTDVRLVHLDAPAHRRLIPPEHSGLLDPAHARPGETVSLADEFPLLLTSLSSLDALNSLVAQGEYPDEGPLPMNRFRPNAVVEGTPAWAEDDWRRISIGEVSFRVVKSCGRCAITTTDQETAERGKEPLRTLARHRRAGTQLLFGRYLIPDTTGVIRVGDPVRVLG